MPEYELRLADAQDMLVVPGMRGEIQVRGKFLFQSYLNRPDATTDSFTSDGWLRTGDAARALPRRVGELQNPQSVRNP